MIKAAAVHGILARFKYLLLVASLSREKPCGVEMWICLASDCGLSAYGEPGPRLWGVEGREGRWHCIRAERGWVGFILPLEHHPQRNGIPGLCHLPQQGKTDEKQ